MFVIHKVYTAFILCLYSVWTSSAGDKLEPVAATLSSTLDTHPIWNNLGSFGAAHCIDGNRGGPEIVDNVAHFCHTKGEPAPWLGIEYGTRVTVQKVEIFTRNGCCGEATRNVDVRIADELPTSASQMFSGGSLLGHYPGPATHGQLITISGEKLQLQIFNADKYPRSRGVWQIRHCPDEFS